MSHSNSTPQILRHGYVAVQTLQRCNLILQITRDYAMPYRNLKMIGYNVIHILEKIGIQFLFNFDVQFLIVTSEMYEIRYKYVLRNIVSLLNCHTIISKTFNFH